MPGPVAEHPAPAGVAEDMRLVPAGPYVAGSDAAEREQAYVDAARTSGDERARQGRWFAAEEPRHTALLAHDVALDRTLVTNAAYAVFVRATGHAAPSIDEASWRRQGLRQDYATQVARFVWQGGAPPPGREAHPVLLVTHADAAAYCAWRGARLPSAAELEKAMRGEAGRTYPWGDAWDGARLDGAGPGEGGDTEPVGAHPAGAGPYGHLDLAGEAFSWTSTPWPGRPGDFTVKGSAWDDHAGVGRGAARHGRPATIRHAIVGFRCARSR